MAIDHITTGGVAFPPYPTDENNYGLSVADWFTGFAVAGLLSNTSLVRGPTVTPDEIQKIADAAYQVASVMVELRTATQNIPTPVPTPKPEKEPPLHAHPIPPSKPPHPPTGPGTTVEISNAPPEEP